LLLLQDPPILLWCQYFRIDKRLATVNCQVLAHVEFESVVFPVSNNGQRFQLFNIHFFANLSLPQFETSGALLRVWHVHLDEPLTITLIRKFDARVCYGQMIRVNKAEGAEY